MKKITKLMSLLLFAAITQYSCINDADVDSVGGVTPEARGNLALSFVIPNNTLTRSAESSDKNETGSTEEYKIKSANVYLFDSKTKTFVESFVLENIQCTGTSEQRIKYTTSKVVVKPGTYNIFAIVNGKTSISDYSTQDKFLGAIDAITYQEGKIPSVPEEGFLMTNRGAANLNIEVSKPVESGIVTHVSIGLERVVAKIEVAQSQSTFPLTDTAGKTYATITINNFRMMNLPTKFYTFRHTAVLNDLQEPAAYTDINFGDINDVNGYVIDPYFFKKTKENAAGFTNSDLYYAQALVDKNNIEWSTMGSANNRSHIYCLENCMYKTAQLNAYSTGVMFKAHVEIATDRVFNANNELVSDPSNWPEKMFYFNYNFYTSIDAIRKNQINNLPSDINENSTNTELVEWKIKRFMKTDNYSCYYNYWIKHVDNKDTQMGVMEFGIVRNNIYRLSVNKVAGLGTGDPFINPEQPDEYDAELEADFEVFPWAVREQDVELE